MLDLVSVRRGVGIAIAVGLFPIGVAAQDDGILSRDAFAAQAGRGDNVPINCTIKPLRVVELSAPVSGVVAEVYANPGDQVTVGDPLVKMDDTMLSAEYALALAKSQATQSLRAAETRRDGLAMKANRLERAYRQKAVSAAEYESAKLDLSLAEAEIFKEKELLSLAKLEEQRVGALLAETVISSPVSGILGEDLINPGEAVGQKPVVTIYVNQPLRVEAYVPSERLADFVRRDQHSILVNNGTTPVAVNFDYAAQVADLASNTISVFFKLNAPEVLPGSKCVMGNEGS